MIASPTAPSLLFGTSSDQLGGGVDQSVHSRTSPPCSDRQPPGSEAVPFGILYEQLPLPGLEDTSASPQRAGLRRSEAIWVTREDDLLTAYLPRLAARGVARKGFLAYRYQLRSILHVATRLAGRAVSYEDLFRDSDLLGRTLVDEVAPTLRTCLSRWTLAQRRSAIRSFASLMRPELLQLLGRDPHTVLDGALRSVAERVGAGYRLRGGSPRRRGGYVPTREQLAGVLDALGRDSGWAGARNRIFFSILLATGARVNALRELDGADCIEMPSGRLRLFLHEKGKAEPREVELDLELSDGLREYAREFNRATLVRGWHARVHLGEPGPVWRNSGRGRWQYKDVITTLATACVTAGSPPITPHALRRAFATDVASALPRHIVALAGGWKGLERLDDHYVHPRTTTIFEKLAQGGTRDDRADCVDNNWRTSHEATIALP